MRGALHLINQTVPRRGLGSTRDGRKRKCVVVPTSRCIGGVGRVVRVYDHELLLIAVVGHKIMGTGTGISFNDFCPVLAKPRRPTPGLLRRFYNEFAC